MQHLRELATTHMDLENRQLLIPPALLPRTMLLIVLLFKMYCNDYEFEDPSVLHTVCFCFWL